jgi:hypothetical protein
MERQDQPQEAPKDGVRGPHEPRPQGEPADHRRAGGPHRRTQALGRWRRHEHDRISIAALVEWELVAFYESFEEPRA